jgi:hypothetical protein
MGVTQFDLYRSGNASSARLQAVRIGGFYPDVDVYLDPTGIEWVRANGKGSSTGDVIDPSWTGRIWRLPPGSVDPDVLELWEDDPAIGSGHRNTICLSRITPPRLAL